MTQTRSTGFEDGTNGSVYTLDTLANGAGSVCSTTHAAHGTKAVKELGSGTYQYVQANFASASTTCRVRYAIAQDTAITSNSSDLELHSDTTSFGSTNRGLLVIRKSTNVLQVNDSLNATIHIFTNTLPTDGSFIVLDLQVVCGTSGNATIIGRTYTSANPSTILDSFSTTTATTTATIQSAHLGKVTSGAFSPSTGITWHDDFQFDDGSGSYIGPYVVTNHPPIANAGPPQSFVEPYSTVTLDGTGSSDPDADAITYAWSQTAGTAVTLSSTTASQPTFTAPATLNGDALTFSLTVNDGTVNSTSPSTVNIAVAAHTMWRITNTVGPVLTPIRVSIL